MPTKVRALTFAFVLAALPSPCLAADAGPQVITLGTAAGPLARPGHSQPATLLRWSKGVILVDAGDGAAEQVVKAGTPFGAIDTIVLTHLHADHTGGLFAFIAMRYQLNLPPFAVYGPPGTARLVRGLTDALGPLSDIRLGTGSPFRNPAMGVVVHEIGDGDTLTLKGVAIKVAANSHFQAGRANPDPAVAQSLSLRFELPGRSVVITGDTGPSQAVVNLAKGADLLVSEIIQPEAALAEVASFYPEVAKALKGPLLAHFVEEHLTAKELGKLAAAAAVKRVVITHQALALGGAGKALSEIKASYRGPVVIAKDLQSY